MAVRTITALDYRKSVYDAALCDAIMAKAGVGRDLVPEIVIDEDRGKAVIRQFALNEEGRKYFVDHGRKPVQQAGRVSWRRPEGSAARLAMAPDIEIDWPYGLSRPEGD
jgi:hypothetical protein